MLKECGQGAAVRKLETKEPTHEAEADGSHALKSMAMLPVASLRLLHVDELYEYALAYYVVSVCLYLAVQTLPPEFLGNPLPPISN